VDLVFCWLEWRSCLATIIYRAANNQATITLHRQQLNAVTLWYAHKTAANMKHSPNNKIPSNFTLFYFSVYELKRIDFTGKLFPTLQNG